MKKITLFLMSLLISVGAMAQTPVLELTESQIGTTYPKQLSDEDAAKVYALTDLTVAVRISNPGTSGRRGLFVTSDPTKEKNTGAEGLNSRYVAYGLNDNKVSYLASWRSGDRFTANNKTFGASDEITCVYVINPTKGKCEIYVNGDPAGNWSGTNPNGFMNNYEITTPKMVKAAHPYANIYIGGGVSSQGNGETFAGTIIGVKVYNGALSASEIAAIQFDDPALLAQAREEFNTAYNAAQAILTEANLSVTETELPLQVTNSNADYYIWTNNAEATEGPIANLVDGVKTKESFFHTNWHGGGELPHYIEVDLGEDNKLSEFMFKYMTRFDVANDYPDGILVSGSNDKSSYTEIYNVTSGLPQRGATEWSSSLISSETAYRYLRFNVSAERTYWHMTEFDIVTNVISVADKYTSVKNDVYNLKSLFDSHSNNVSYNVKKLNEATAALNALVETVNAGAVTPEFSYETLDKPTFAKGGNTTKVAMVKLNGENLEGFTYTQGQTTRFNMPQVVAGQTYNLDLTYEMAWGDLAIFQIDKNSNEKKYGYYTCTWEANGSPFGILVRDNSGFMCQELEIPSIESLEAISINEAIHLTIPYKITIPENLEAGDVVVVRVMVGKHDNGAYNAKNISEGGCLDLVFEVKKSHSLTVTNAGYSTLYLDYNAEIPADLEAYTVTNVNEGWVDLTQVTGVLPAETGIIVKASQGDYTFVASEENTEDVTGNLLKGSVEDVYVGGAAYVLGIVENEVGLYQALLNKNEAGESGTTHFKNNAYKAYLPATAVTSGVKALRFNFDGETTAIETVETENANAPIYDLSGRRVVNTVKGGIYIQNGKKFIVK